MGRRMYAPSMDDTLTMKEGLRSNTPAGFRNGDCRDSFNREHSTNGAIALIAITSASSGVCTSASCFVQELSGRKSSWLPVMSGVAPTGK